MQRRVRNRIIGDGIVRVAWVKLLFEIRLEADVLSIGKLLRRWPIANTAKRGMVGKCFGRCSSRVFDGCRIELGQAHRKRRKTHAHGTAD